MRPAAVDLVVLAKAPAPGRTKTRCTPPCTPHQAAALAEAALADTLAVVLATPARRRILVLDGPPGRWLPPGFEVRPQCGGGLDERLEAAMADTLSWDDLAPAVLIGMDTPQVTSAQLTRAAARLVQGADAVLGLALDGGFWGIGLARPAPGAFLGVPMSTAHTGAAQRRRLLQMGLAVELLDELRDVDTWADALAVAALHPRSHLAREVAAISDQLGAGERRSA
jgi:rSAM/selenodomain-associated transferase 1